MRPTDRLDCHRTASTERIEPSNKAAVGPGDGIGAEVVRFNGTVLLVNSAITAGVGVVLNGAAFSAAQTCC